MENSKINRQVFNQVLIRVTYRKNSEEITTLYQDMKHLYFSLKIRNLMYYVILPFLATYINKNLSNFI